jgi:hypothetical protein
MGHESLATNEVIDYTMRKGTYRNSEVKRLLYARFGNEVGGEIGRLVPGSGTIFEVIGALGGHSAAMVYPGQVRR